MSAVDFSALLSEMREWAAALGFQQLGVAGIELGADETHLLNWLRQGRHGEMD